MNTNNELEKKIIEWQNYRKALQDELVSSSKEKEQDEKFIEFFTQRLANKTMLLEAVKLQIDEIDKRIDLLQKQYANIAGNGLKN